MTHNLIINHRDIKCDALGRFNLNELHIAAGGDKKYQPAFWLRSDRTQKLIKQLIDEKQAGITFCENAEHKFKPVHTIQGKGKEQGTYVVKELVYDYAMWISPQFSLKVIRAFDALQTRHAQPQTHSAATVPFDNAALVQAAAHAAALATEHVCERAFARIEEPLNRMADAMHAVLTQHNTTRKYIAVLEHNQRGPVRVNYQSALEAMRLVAGGYSIAAAARMMRFSTSTLSQVINGKYPFSPNLAVPDDYADQAHRLRVAIDEMREFQAQQRMPMVSRQSHLARPLPSTQ